MQELVNIISTTLGYKVNATAPITDKDMALKALKRGR